MVECRAVRDGYGETWSDARMFDGGSGRQLLALNVMRVDTAIVAADRSPVR
jgi:hypothetical protein